MNCLKVLSLLGLIIIFIVNLTSIVNNYFNDIITNTDFYKVNIKKNLNDNDHDPSVAGVVRR